MLMKKALYVYYLVHLTPIRFIPAVIIPFAELCKKTPVWEQRILSSFASCCFLFTLFWKISNWNAAAILHRLRNNGLIWIFYVKFHQIPILIESYFVNHSHSLLNLWKGYWFHGDWPLRPRDFGICRCFTQPKSN